MKMSLQNKSALFAPSTKLKIKIRAKNSDDDLLQNSARHQRALGMQNLAKILVKIEFMRKWNGFSKFLDYSGELS
jgi:hypothetical protein